MKNKKSAYFCFFVFVSVAVLFLCLECRKFENVRYITVTDTLTTVVTKVVRDTIIKEVPSAESETKKGVDTLYVHDTLMVYLPITQKHYKDDGYELWISGYKPNLDNIILYPKTEYKYITNEIVKEVYPKTFGLSANLDLWYCNRSIYPTLSLELETPKRWGIRAGVGYMNRNIAYSLGVKYKILGK